MYLKPIKIASLLLALTGCFLFTGCNPYGDPQITTSQYSRPSYTISMEQLASRLNMSVAKSGNPHCELTDANNRVLIFTYPGGSVWVNGTNIGKVGSVTKSNGTFYVPDLLVAKIRGHLISSYSPPNPTPYQPPATIRTGSGVVVIDPGHGGKDPGATSYLGYYEKGVNLQISRKVANYLKDAGVTVIMTRNSDSYPELEDRAAIANRNNADLFVSIHCDSIGNRTHKGYTIYIARSASWSSKKAGRILESSLAATGIASKGMRKADYKVLVQTIGPAVLIECGYLTNPTEAANLENGWYQGKIARAIADGIIEYLN
ncbi:MAG: N-acetylmuramoyl-L-alanine amidase family protein [Planctomycetota bacterium]